MVVPLVRFKDMTEEKSVPLLRFLYDHCRREEFTCRFQWKANSVAFWDNRCVQHFALNDCNGQRRIMHRLTASILCLSPRGTPPPETLPKPGKQRYDYCNAGRRHS